MSDARWIEVEDDVDSACRHFGNAALLYDQGGLRTPGLSRPAILSGDVADAADESSRFRHRATHDYDNFEPALAVPSIEAARILAAGLKGSILAFRDVIDPA